MSEGTIRNCDLVPKFHDFLVAHGQPVPFGIEPEAPGNPDHSWWESEDSCKYLVQLFECLNDMAPEGYYFGSHMGDGACFGFWESEEI